MKLDVQHPYRTLPPYTRWKSGVTAADLGEVDPLAKFPFNVAAQDKVATAGSCFAQHIARHLRKNGLNYFVTEDAHPLLTEELRARYNYGVYSARYGNIYTARQLLQLFDRAFARSKSDEEFWKTNDGLIVDPFRPAIQPRGFATVDELFVDRMQHLACVRRMFQEMNFFVFTLGLTEEWISARSGTSYPLCPGVQGGTFDPSVHKLINQTVSSVKADLDSFANKIIQINPNVRIIITVSPVPLVATANDRHVLLSNTYSKSVLRAAAQEFCDGMPEMAAYFPSYEIITGHHTRGVYFAEDLRSVTELGVEHVVRVFFKHVYNRQVSKLSSTSSQGVIGRENFLDKMTGAMKVVCEEELLQ